MKKLISTIALTVVLTAGIASPISALAATTKANPIPSTTHDGGGPFSNCVPGVNCVI